MTNKTFLILIISALMIISGCSRQNADAAKFSAIKNPQKMTHRTLSIYKPGDWQEAKEGMILYYLPPGATATDTLAEKVVVAVYQVPDNSSTTLAAFMKDDFTAEQKAMPALKLVSNNEQAKLGPLAAREEKYETQLSGKNLIIDQLDARTGNLLYKIQHYCPADNCRANAIFSEMIGSFAPIFQTP